jgi:hypothetical protein
LPDSVYLKKPRSDTEAERQRREENKTHLGAAVKFFRKEKEREREREHKTRGPQRKGKVKKLTNSIQYSHVQYLVF